VHQKNLDDAWHGDKVAVAVFPGKRRGKNPEGRIARVIERGTSELPARVLKGLGRGDYLCRPTDPRFDFNLLLDARKLDEKPEPGEIVFAQPGEKVEQGLWAAQALELLGAEDDVEVQEKLVKAAHDVPTEFPESVLNRAANLPDAPDERDYEGREDLRDVELVTIDGAKARDFDDAVFAERTKKGFRLIVAIADVAHYVSKGGPLDREALARGNSYYFPRSVEPMFPEALSNGLCSLNPNVDRLAVCAEIVFDKAGNPVDEKFYEAVIRSHARLTYSQVFRALVREDEDERLKLGPLMPMLDVAADLARLLRKLRRKRGSLDFDLPEPQIFFNIYGEVVDLRPKPTNFAHHLIEEFMIAANEAVARRLTDSSLPCMYRIHPEPDAEKLKSLFSILYTTTLADRVPSEATPKALQDLLSAAEDSDVEFLVNRLVLRSMMQATYDTKNVGHFGLASDCYCHFTSPIRRYADLINHRSLKALLSGDSDPKLGDLKSIGEDISKLERVAMEAEREILKRLTIMFLREKLGETFSGVVNGMADFGFWVELEEVVAEGMVRLSTLDDDYYVYFPERMMMVGERTGKRIRLGQKVKARLADVNLQRLEVNLELVEITGDVGERREKKKGKKGKGKK
jgi:ribonuclease R